MRLLTHNQLICIVKGCVDNFPLRLENPALVAEDEAPEASAFDEALALSLLRKVDYPALYAVATELGVQGLIPPADLPPLASITVASHSEFLQALLRALLDVHVESGDLVCPKCGRHYPIQRGIPYMRLQDHEVA